MDVETAIREIDEAIATEVGGTDEAFDESLRAALSTVEAAAGGAAVEELTRFVAGHVREHGSRPDPATVDERAVEVVDDHGGELPDDSYLNNA